MSINTAIETSVALNNEGKIGNPKYGFIINWETLPWLKSLSSNADSDYWLEVNNWFKLCKKHNFDKSDHVYVGKYDPKIIWISQQLKQIADERNWNTVVE